MTKQSAANFGAEICFSGGALVRFRSNFDLRRKKSPNADTPTRN